MSFDLLVRLLHAARPHLTYTVLLAPHFRLMRPSIKITLKINNRTCRGQGALRLALCLPRQCL